MDLSSLQEVYSTIMTDLKGVDEKLDLASDPKAAARRRILDSLIETAKSNWQGVTQQITSHVSTLGPDVALGFYYGLMNALHDNFKEKFDKSIAEKVEAEPVEQINLSDEETKALSEKRSEIYKQVKAIRELASLFGSSGEEFALPKKRTGGRGPRGPRTITMYDWTVNGEVLTGENNTLAAIAKAHGYERTMELREAMKKAGIVISSLQTPAEVTFQLKDGKTLTGKWNSELAAKMASQEEEGDEDEDEEEGGEDSES